MTDLHSLDHDRRLAVFVLPPPQIADAIERKRDLVFDAEDLGDARDIIGGSRLYPPHVTVKGAFRLSGSDGNERRNQFDWLVGELASFAREIPSVTLRTANLTPRPARSISIGFNPGSIQELRALQRRVVDAVEHVRLKIVEPNFRSTPEAASALAQDPSVGPNYWPHMTVVGGPPGGITDQQMLPTVMRVVGEDFGSSWEFSVGALDIWAELSLGGPWKHATTVELGD
jgi:2'-5' RNA ligase